MKSLPARLIGLYAFFVVLVPAAASACPTCKDSLTEQYIAAYGASILFMMSMPFLILGSLGAYFWWEVRKARLRQQQEANIKGDAVADRSAI